MTTYKCIYCGKESVWASNKINKYCSKECYNLDKIERYRESSTFICNTCGESFYRVANKKDGKKFCSHECFVKFQKEHCPSGKDSKLYNQIEKHCIVCGDTYLVPPYKSDSKFCSRECQGQYKSLNARGSQYVTTQCSLCGVDVTLTIGDYNHRKKRNNHIFCCREHSAKYVSLHSRGENHSNWKGTTPFIKAIRLLPEYYIWRKSCFDRDHYKCTKCGSKKNIIVHHIIHLKTIIMNFKLKTIEEVINNSLFLNIDNGITLCTECHKQEHKDRRKLDGTI